MGLFGKKKKDENKGTGEVKRHFGSIRNIASKANSIAHKVNPEELKRMKDFAVEEMKHAKGELQSGHLKEDIKHKVAETATKENTLKAAKTLGKFSFEGSKKLWGTYKNITFKCVDNLPLFGFQKKMIKFMLEKDFQVLEALEHGAEKAVELSVKGVKFTKDMAQEKKAELVAKALYKENIEHTAKATLDSWLEENPLKNPNTNHNIRLINISEQEREDLSHGTAMEAMRGFQQAKRKYQESHPNTKIYETDDHTMAADLREALDKEIARRNEPNMTPLEKEQKRRENNDNDKGGHSPIGI